MTTTDDVRHTPARVPRVTAPEALTGPVAGALVGFAVFAIGAVVIGALFGTNQFGLADEDWATLGFGASVGAGLLMFVGFTYGGFVAGRLGGVGQRGLVLGLFTFVSGVVMAALAGWAVKAGADAAQAERLANSLRALGVPGNIEGWRDVATTAGVASLLGMLLGSLTGGLLARRDAADRPMAGARRH